MLSFAVQLSTIAEEWEQAINGYKLVLMMHPGDKGTEAAIKKAKQYIAQRGADAKEL